MKNICTLCLILFCAQFSFAQNDDDKNAILKVLEDQRLAWNSGSLEEYMQGYWKSDSLMFIGKNGVKYGWNETLASYIRGYPSQKEMEKLTFTVISLDFLSGSSAYMVGKWNISRVDNNIMGHFLLIWKKVKSSWLIVADHSS